MDGLTPEEKADLALLMQANEHGGFAIEVGSNKHQALNRSACSGSPASATGACVFCALRGRRRLKRFFKMTA